MKTAEMLCAKTPVLARSRAADYLELAKPRISIMVLVTVAAGALMATVGPIDWAALCQTLLGTALVATGASALNQFLERDSDALMRRTEDRPLPSGRLQPFEVGVFGAVFGLVGVLYLVAAGQKMAAAIAAGTFVAYVFLYTPLKRVTTLNTLIGAIPGAMPPVIGWVSVARIDGKCHPIPDPFLGGASLSGHCLDLQKDYAQAGCMLPVVDSGSALPAGR